MSSPQQPSQPPPESGLPSQPQPAQPAQPTSAQSAHPASPQPTEPPLTSRLENRITLRVCDDNNNEYAFMMKHSTPFKRIFDAFSHKVGVRIGTFRFHYEGLRLAEEDTPGRVGLRDDDLIEAFVLAEGGSWRGLNG